MAQHPPDITAQYHPANRREDILRVEQQVLDIAQQLCFPPASLFALRLVLEEALVNAFMHGHRGLPASETVSVHLRAGTEALELVIEDKGPGYNPRAVPDCTCAENIERPHGRGLMLIRSFMSEVRHELNGRRLVMVYRRPG